MSDSSETKGQKRKLLGAVRQGITKTETVASEASQKAMKIGGELVQNVAKTARGAVGKVQRKLGEDYYAILKENPLVQDTLSRSGLLVENKDLLSTVFNIPWITSVLWNTAAGNSPPADSKNPIADFIGHYLHYAPGHIKRFEKINKFMDSRKGIGHRLKFGHSIDYLPEIVETYGIEGVPGYFMHIVQDFTTDHGIPTIPNTWDFTKTLRAANVPRKVATGLVSISFASTLGALAVLTFIAELWKSAKALATKMKTQKYLKTASSAIYNNDYNAAITNYQRALEIERNPFILMALGQVYMGRAANRLRAHHTFIDAVTLLADNPELTAPYHHGQISVRGLAGLQALSTADVLSEIHPEHWNDHVLDLVNATVFSFSSAALKQTKQSDDLIPNAAVIPAHFSAAINYYLAAKSACYYPFVEERKEKVLKNINAAVRSLGLMAQYDEEKLRTPANTIRQLWTMELLPSDEIEMALASY